MNLIGSLRLEWRRPVKGIAMTAVPHMLARQIGAGSGKIWSVVDDDHEPLSYVLKDLEDLVSIRFLNCVTDQDFADFLSRFGVLRSPTLQALHPPENDWSLADHQSGLRLVFSLANVGDASTDAVATVNSTIKFADLRPQVVIRDGHPKLEFQASSLADFLYLEAAAAVEAGAHLADCDHCRKLFLVGPRTYRRTHSRFCADKCRVAAFRSRRKELS